MPDKGRGNKWMSDYMQSAWVEISFKGVSHTVAGIGFVTAPDTPFYDPKKIEIKYKDEDTQAWVDCKTLKPEFTPDRNELYRYNITACKTTAFKFIMSHQENSHGHIHMGQIQFYGDPESDEFE